VIKAEFTASLLSVMWSFRNVLICWIAAQEVILNIINSCGNNTHFFQYSLMNGNFIRTAFIRNIIFVNTDQMTFDRFNA